MLRMLISKSILLASCNILFLTWNIGAAATRDGTHEAVEPTYIPVHIGAVLNLNSDVGTMADVCISLARKDFYSVHSDYQTRLNLHVRDAQHELDVVSEVLDLLNSEDIQGILGPQTWTEDTFAAELGRKAQVPVISFTSRSQSPSHVKNPFFLRTIPDNSNQVKALAAICKAFEWHEVLILYEDTYYGIQFTSELNREFLRVGIQLANMIAISTSAADHHINEQVQNLTTTQTRVFIVHTNAVLGSRFFLLARRAGMMSEGFAWLVTDGIGNFINSIDSPALESMEGILGIRPHIPESKQLENFKERWKRSMILNKKASTKVELNAYGYWAYDTVWALAMAAEKIRLINTSFSKLSIGEKESHINNFRLSQFGPKLLDEVKKTSFLGLSGEFRLIDGKLKSSALEIFNVLGSDRKIIGYWTPDGGLSRNLASTGERPYSTSTKGLKTVVWPGDSVQKPIGWSIPNSGKLKVWVPRKSGFTQFVKITTDPSTNKTNATGFCIDIFLYALDRLPFKVDHEFKEFDPAGTPYSDFINSLPNRDFSIMVGDTTILADRARSVDFSLPYFESAIVWVVKDKQEKNMWVFIKPFRWDLWVTILATCIFIGVVLRILEYHTNYNSDSVRPGRQKLGMLFWFPIAVLAFPERNMVANNWSRFVLVVWVFMSYILMQSYTANLTAMFTVDQLEFPICQDYVVGYQVGSFVKEFLINRLHINETKLKSYSSIKQYHEAMTLGGKNGGIDAIFDEIPYMKLLLNSSGSKYKMLRKRYRTDGFGFAFPKDSRLVPHFSKAILEVTESPNMSRIEEKNFGSGYYPENLTISIGKQNQLTAYDFGGLFIIIGSAMVLALVCSVPSIGPKLVVYILKWFPFLPLGGNNLSSDSMVHPADSNHSSGEQEIQMSTQIVGNGPAMPEGDHQSAHVISNVLADCTESEQNNESAEGQQPGAENIDTPTR